METTLNKIFDILPGNSLDLSILEELKPKSGGGTNYVSRTRENNGISAYVKVLPDVQPFEAGLITVAGSGNSVLESFIQPEPFYTGYHVFILKPKKPLSDLEKLFYCYCIRQNQYKYNYGRQANSTLKNLKVPESIPSAFSSIPLGNLINLTKKSVLETKLLLETRKWKPFKFGGKNGIFIIKNGFYNKKPERIEKGKIPFIGATEYNNGVTEWYSISDIETATKTGDGNQHDLSKKLFEGNCITVSNNGSVGYAFYQRNEFTCSHDVNVLYLKDRSFNEYIALFICTLIELDRYRWAYGRKWRPTRMPESIIKLPVKSDGLPDWDFMENYIKTLPFSQDLH